MSRRFLIVQLADIGDLILSTPALAALREAHPDAHVAMLTTAHAAPVLPPGLVDEVIAFDKHTFDSPKALLHPANLRRALALALRAAARALRHDDLFASLHDSFRRAQVRGAGVERCQRQPDRAGQRAAASSLTHRLVDQGFGAKHQAQYWLDLVGIAGADPSPRPAQVKISPLALWRRGWLPKEAGGEVPGASPSTPGAAATRRRGAGTPLNSPPSRIGLPPTATPRSCWSARRATTRPPSKPR